MKGTDSAFVPQGQFLPSAAQWSIFFLATSFFSGYLAVWWPLALYLKVTVIGCLYGMVLFLVFRTRSVLIIDVHQGTVCRVVFPLNLKLGGHSRIKSIEKIFINQITRLPGTKLFDSRFIENVYKAFIKFDAGEKIELMVSTEKELLVGRLFALNKVLKTEIWDNTNQKSRPIRDEGDPS